MQRRSFLKKASVGAVAGSAATVTMTARYDNLNPVALRRLLSQGTQLRPFPRAVMDACWDAAQKVYEQTSAKNERFKRILANYMGYRDELVPWFRVAEASYDQYGGAALSRAKK